MIDYAGNEVFFNGCPGCAYAKAEFSLPCGLIYENERFTLSQDWELPIEGFLVVSPKQHVETLNEMSYKERIEMLEIVNKTINILRNNNICDKFNIICEEKENRHLHVWIMPRYKWMENITKSITGNIHKIFEYAKSNMVTNETIERIQEISDIVKNEYKNNEYI